MTITDTAVRACGVAPYRTCKGCTRHRRPCKIRTGQIGSGEVGTAQICTGQITVYQNSTFQIGTAQIDARECTISEIRPR